MYLLSSNSCFCQCSQGSCLSTAPGNSICIWNTGFQALPGSQQIASCTAPTTGVYQLTVSLVDGRPPSAVNVVVNNKTVAQLNVSNLSPGATTSTSFIANQGDAITLSASWGALYDGGTLQVELTAPSSPPPSSSPIPIPSSNLLLIIMAAVIVILVAVVLYLYIKRKRG